MAEIVDFETFARNAIKAGYKDVQVNALLDLYTAAKGWEPVVTEEVHEWLSKGEKIQAIKQYRDDNTMPDGKPVGLKDAVDVVNALIDADPEYTQAWNATRGV